MDVAVRGGVGRSLLGLTDNIPMSPDMTLNGTALIVTAVAMIVVIVAVVAMCVCNQNSSPQLTTISPRKPTVDGIANETTPPQARNPVACNDISVEIPDAVLVDSQLKSPPLSPDSLGEVNKRESGQGAARTSATLSRQLPDPPVVKDAGQGASQPEGHAVAKGDQRLSNTTQSSQKEDDLEDYDRLQQAKVVIVEDPGYDHVDQALIARQRSSVASNKENIYATPTGESSDSGSGTVTAPAAMSKPIRENIYAVPNGETFESGSGIVAPPENAYTVPLEEEDANYSTIPSKRKTPVEYNQTDSEYDPYAKIDSGNQVTTSPLNFTHDTDISAAASANASPPAVAPSSDNADNSSPVLNLDEMYAIVNRNPKPPALPPPPVLTDHLYDSEDGGILPGAGSLSQLADLSSDSGLDNSTDTVLVRKPEPSYTEVTARESLASMQLRQQNQVQSLGGAAAATGYESFPDIPENYYARVDGSSGDGAFSAQGAVALDVLSSRNSDMYSEINVSGGSYQTIAATMIANDLPAPAPPPVDRLPPLRQHPNGDGGQQPQRIEPEHNEQGYAIVTHSSKRKKKQNVTIPNSRSVDENLGLTEIRRVTGAINRLAENRKSAPLATVESDHDLSIDFGYHSVKDVPDLEQESDFDSYYESVDDMKKKSQNKKKVVPVVNGAASGLVHPRRQHEYEEVNDLKELHTESAYDVKKRVLLSHCYEDISDVKEQQLKKHLL